ncbi:aminoglycoside phosphotransferase family protein [Patescibacteria group bacterium]|nr:MAG: aminoglycoside phosphotransferase family protein [Patescibacteria group bacterium]
MTMMFDWQRDIEPFLDTMQPVEGGYSLAERGVVTIGSGLKVFVKIAEGEMTKKWLRKEIIAYQKLNSAGYPYIPTLLAYNESHSAMAIEYLNGASFENIWDTDKLDAILNTQKVLRDYKQVFIDDPNFTLESVIGLDSKWGSIMKVGAIEKINTKFAKLGVDASFTREQIRSYEAMLEGWKIADDTLVHQDIRADNFGYDPITRQGKLVDWNWLCLGDVSLDRTPLFVNMYISGFDPYVHHPETYDAKMLAYLVSFWLDRVLNADEDENELAFKRMKAQATSVRAAVELLDKSTTR